MNLRSRASGPSSATTHYGTSPVAAVHPTSLVDFPGHIAATVFMGGCNLRCPFCHNPELVVSRWRPVMTISDLRGWLAERSGFIDGVCITGGEPTLWPAELAAICAAAQDAGLGVKLDTNGTKPAVVERLVDDGLVEYVAVDIKASPSRYELAAGCSVDTGAVRATVELLRHAGIGHELRTTVVPRLHDRGELVRIGRWIGGPSRYCLQPFRPGKTLDARWACEPPPTQALMAELRQAAEEFFPTVEVRA